MATLLERIDADRTQARKDSKAEIASFLGYLLAEARRVGKDAENRDSTDNEVIGVIRKLISRNEENLTLTHGGDANAVWQNKILNQFLPTQLDEAALTSLISAFITGQNWTDVPISVKMLGSVMSMLKETHPGQYSPQLASQVAKRLLQPSETP